MLKRITLLILLKTVDFGACQKWEPASRIGDFGNFLTVSLKAHACFDCPEYWMSAICIAKIVKYCILHRGLYDKNSASRYCFTSDVMYKKYKRLVYTSPDLLARFCTVNMSNGKNSAWFCLPGLIYCDQEPLWLLNVIEDDCYFLGVHIRLSTRCKIKFTLRWTVCKLSFSKIT